MPKFEKDSLFLAACKGILERLRTARKHENALRHSSVIELYEDVEMAMIAKEVEKVRRQRLGLFFWCLLFCAWYFMCFDLQELVPVFAQEFVDANMLKYIFFSIVRIILTLFLFVTSYFLLEDIRKDFDHILNNIASDAFRCTYWAQSLQ